MLLNDPSFLLAITGMLFLLIAFFQKFLPYIPTDKKTVKDIQKLANKNKNKQKAVDLGSGDGRIVIALAKAGYEAHGYEINPLLILRSRRKIKKLGLENKAYIHWGNFWEKDLASFDLVVVYGITYVMQDLKNKFLKELKKNAIFICNTYTFKDWNYVKQSGKAYLYKISDI